MSLFYPENLTGYVREELENQQAKRPDGAVYERERGDAMGDPIDIPYLSTDFTGSGSLVWTITPKHISTLAYSMSGMQMTVTIYAVGFTVSGTGSILRFKIPGGYKAARHGGEATSILIDNGTRTTGAVNVTASVDDDVIKITRTDVANFTASTENSSLVATITFWVKSQAV